MKNTDNDLIPAFNAVNGTEVTATTLMYGPQPFSVLSGGDLRTAKLPPRINVLGEGVIASGQLTGITGPQGSGKGRLAMHIAIAQVLGIPFAGLPTHAVPLRHLFIGNEHSFERLSHDYLRLTSKLSAEERQAVDAHLFFHVVESCEDAFIGVARQEDRQRWLDTLAAYRPDCIHAGPLSEIHGGDLNDYTGVRRTLGELARICRAHNPATAIIVLHHDSYASRASARSGGAASEALLHACRCQLNVAPDAVGNHIVLSCAKANDFKPFDPVTLCPDEDATLHRTDPGFSPANPLSEAFCSFGPTHGTNGAKKPLLRRKERLPGASPSGHAAAPRHPSITTNCKPETKGHE